MLAEEFIRAVSNGDFVKLVGADKLNDFAKYVNEMESQGYDKILIRALFQIPQSDGVPTPYYVWIMYNNKASEDDESFSVVAPNFDEPSSLLEQPEEYRGIPYFEVFM